MKVKVCQKTTTDTNGAKETLYGLKDQDGKIVLTPQFDKIHDFSPAGKFVYASRKGEVFIWRVKKGDPAGINITAETLIKYPSEGRIHFSYEKERMYYRMRSGKLAIFNEKSLVPLWVHGNVRGINFLGEWTVVLCAGKYRLYDPAGNHVDSYRYCPFEMFYDSNLFLFRKDKRSARHRYINSQGYADIVKIEGDKKTTIATVDDYCYNVCYKVIYYKPFNEKYWKAIGESSGYINLFVKFKFTHIRERGEFVVGLNGKKFTILKRKRNVFEMLSEVEIEGYSEEELESYHIFRMNECPTLSVDLYRPGSNKKTLFSFTAEDGKIVMLNKILDDAVKVGLASPSGYSVWLIKNNRQLLVVDANMKEFVKESIPVGCEPEDFVPDESFHFRRLVNETRNYIIVQNNPSNRTLIVNKTTGACIWYGAIIITNGRWDSTNFIGEIYASNIHYESDTLLNRSEGYLIDLAESKVSDKIVHLPRFFSTFSFSRELGMAKFSGRNGKSIIKVDMISEIFPQKD